MTMKAANAFVAMVSLLWWSVLLVSITVCSGYDKANLRTFEVNPYRGFIANLRKNLPTSGDKAGIKLLEKSPKKDKEFLLAELESNGKKVTLSLDSRDLYLLGYQVGNEAWIFDKIPSGAADKLYPPKQVKQNKLGFEGSYTDLERQPGPRSEIKIGMLKLKDSALLLAKYPNGRDGNTDKTKQRAEALLVLIQMISEAVRFKYIENFVTEKAWENRKPDNQMIKYELNWETLASQIRKAKKDEISQQLKDDVYVVKP